jgi:hypothetical protein
MASTLAFVSSFRNERTSEENIFLSILKWTFSFVLFLGKESLQSEEKESDHWNGSSFGWTLSTLSTSIYVSTTLWKTIN